MQRVHVALVGDRHADLADLAAGELVVGVVAGLRRQVEGDREARLALGEVRAVQLVGRLRGRMARVGAHHPGAVALRKAVLAHRCTDCMVRRPCADPSSTVPGSPRGFARSTCATPSRGAATASRRRGAWTSSGTATSPRPATSSWPLRRARRPAARRARARRRLRHRPDGAAAGRLPVVRRVLRRLRRQPRRHRVVPAALPAPSELPLRGRRPLQRPLQPARARSAPTSTASRTTTTSFDFVLATSVFTHLLEADATHYLAECARVLAPGRARCFATFFLLNDDEPRAAIEAGGAGACVPRRRPARRDPRRGAARGGGRLRRRVGVRGAADARADVEPAPGRRGRGAPEHVSFQDIVVAHA